MVVDLMPNRNKKLEQIYLLLNESNSTFVLFDKEVYLKTCRLFQLDKENCEYVVAGAIFSSKDRAGQPLGYIVVRVTKETLRMFPKCFDKYDLDLTTKGLSVFVNKNDVGKKVLSSI